ncbi:ExeA family protein [Shewanella cyperi]|uniref:ExeA family protein n=1 Tax=Shewanella cyperi TaxID=2814292 RepID=UPI001A9509D8|nr:AAA family ATPase [Shewanella cyperi]QSX40467.1 AAA family ATPase [Shewanella cyperi]
MYLQHFGLSEAPFALTPNTSFFLAMTPHVEALQVLQTALQTGEGFIKVTGEVGTGKTLLLRKLLNELPPPLRCAYLPNPCLSPSELRWALASELGLKYSANIDQQQLTSLIQQQLLALAAHGHAVVLILDEAQALPTDSLETLRLFTNLETETRKLLQVVLFGQPELDQRLASAELRQLRQRITFSYRLRPLDERETQTYLNHRLAVAGFKGAPMFGAAEARLLQRASRGIPRLLNILAHKALMLAFGAGDSRPSRSQLRAAIKDTEDATQGHWPLSWAGWLACGALLTSLVLWFGGVGQWGAGL